MKSNLRSSLKAALALLLAFGLASPVLAQSVSATITGTVQDKSGAVLKDAIEHCRQRKGPAFLHAVVHGHPEWPKQYQTLSRRVQCIDFEGEPILIFLCSRGGREAVVYSPGHWHHDPEDGVDG